MNYTIAWLLGILCGAVVVGIPLTLLLRRAWSTSAYYGMLISELRQQLINANKPQEPKRVRNAFE